MVGGGICAHGGDRSVRGRCRRWCGVFASRPGPIGSRRRPVADGRASVAVCSVHDFVLVCVLSCRECRVREHDTYETLGHTHTPFVMTHLCTTLVQ